MFSILIIFIQISISEIIKCNYNFMTRHMVFFSRYRSYFYHNERTTQASDKLSYIFWIHDLIAGWGALYSCVSCLVVCAWVWCCGSVIYGMPKSRQLNIFQRTRQRFCLYSTPPSSITLITGQEIQEVFRYVRVLLSLILNNNTLVETHYQ